MQYILGNPGQTGKATLSPAHPRLHSTQYIHYADLSATLYSCFQCFDTVGWAPGRASVLLTMSDEVLAWLSVWSEVQIVCTRGRAATARTTSWMMSVDDVRI